MGVAWRNKIACGAVTAEMVMGVITALYYRTVAKKKTILDVVPVMKANAYVSHSLSLESGLFTTYFLVSPESMVIYNCFQILDALNPVLLC